MLTHVVVQIHAVPVRQCSQSSAYVLLRMYCCLGVAQLLAAGCPGDPVVEAVAASLPASAATAGLPTLQQLQQQFKAVTQQAAEAAYFAGEAEGGILARLVAKLAVQLKVDAGSTDGGFDSNIAQVGGGVAAYDKRV